jgi:hypothetical protein
MEPFHRRFAALIRKRACFTSTARRHVKAFAGTLCLFAGALNALDSAVTDAMI